MSLRKFFMLSIVVTAFALFYIQMQTTIYALAYQGQVEEERVSRLHDSNANRALSIAKLRSPQNLGSWYFCDNTDSNFANQRNIVQVKATSNEVSHAQLAVASRSVWNPISLLARLFSLKSVAEAQPIR